MIRINLLARKRKKPRPVPAFISAGGIVLALAVIVTFYFNYFMKGKMASLARQKSDNDAKIALLKSKIEDVKNYERLNREFTERKQIIEQLRQNQALPVKVLDEISARLTDGVWLTSLNLTQDDIQMEGIGYTNDDVVAFVQSLKGSPLFTDVYLVGTSQTSDEGVDVYHFSLTMKVKA
ncbi:MAG: PilN domain-containing protein [Nitrospiraceae bacterium]|nr:PilN domain-containing protein [Nitrospiraceae bacterium]